MRVYVASKMDNREAVRAFMGELRSDGHKIAYDWTVHTSERADHSRQALADMRGVMKSDVLIQIYKEGTKGSLIELGILIGYSQCVVRNMRAIIVAPETGGYYPVADYSGPPPVDPAYTVFENLENVYRVGTLSAARALLKVWESDPDRNDVLELTEPVYRGKPEVL